MVSSSGLSVSLKYCRERERIVFLKKGHSLESHSGIIVYFQDLLKVKWLRDSLIFKGVSNKRI